MRKNPLKVFIPIVMVLLISACGSNPSANDASDVSPEDIPELAGLSEDQIAWLESAQLGYFEPETQDWDAIEAAAREEGQVVIYSVSSRIFNLQEEFMDKYGIEIIGYDLSSDVQLEKLRRENKAGIYEADVLFNSEAPIILNEFLPQGLVWNFVPESVVHFLEPDELEPLLVQRWSSRILVYNTYLNPDSAPLDNLWDLTTDEWTGKFLMPDPLEDSIQANVIQTILAHPDEMAEAYELEFGEPLTEFSEDLLELFEEDFATVLEEPNASMEWMYRLLQNEPVFIGSTTKIGNNVGDVLQEDAPVGFTTFSKIRGVEEGIYEWGPAYEVVPTFGVSYPTVLVIADQAPHPNAAKLLIRYMMEEGFYPWNEPGDYASNVELEAQQTEEYNIPAFDDLGLWGIDPSQVYDTKYIFLTLYLELK